MELLGVPFDGCGYRPGARLGPGAVRLAGLVPTLEKLGYSIADHGDLLVDQKDQTQPGGLRNFEPAHKAYRETASHVQTAIRNGKRPLVVGGDHSNAIGSVGGVLNELQGDCAVLWIDAHADLNTPATSPSGNLHGMPLAVLGGLPSGVTGLQDLQWKTLQDEFAKHPLDGGRIAWLGLRDVDPGEREALRSLRHEYAWTMYDIDRYGMVRAVEEFEKWLRNCGTKNLYISFDVDSLDPVLAPGTGTAVRGGLTYREMHLLAEMLCEMHSQGKCNLVGVEIVEVSPIIDTQNATAIIGVEWIASLFGKTILGSRA
jgi:arginase